MIFNYKKASNNNSKHKINNKFNQKIHKRNQIL